MTETITLSPQRKLGDILLDCTVEEDHTDDLTITGHPVEQGAQVSDHAFREPSVVVLSVGFSNSSVQAGGDESYVRNRYDDILTLQRSREPFTIVTGKRTYQNMLIRGIAVKTDQTTEAVLSARLTCREVIIVQTQTVAVPDSAVQADPKKTAAIQNAGTQVAQPATMSPTGD